jgi:hypothetical protein
MPTSLGVVVADPDVVDAMLGVLHDGFRLVSRDVLERASVGDFEAVESLLRSEHELTSAAAVRSVREFAEVAQDFLDGRPEWGR